MSTRLQRLWREWVRPLLGVVIVFGSFRSACADWNDVPTGSMKPTILEGDRIFVNKLAYDLKIPFTTLHLAEWGDPKRGDIVVLWSPYDEKRLVKRVVGIPGDTIETPRGRLFVNHQAAAYSSLLRRPAPGRLTGDEAVFQRETVEGKAHPVMSARHGLWNLPGRGRGARRALLPDGRPQGQQLRLALLGLRRAPAHHRPRGGRGALGGRGPRL